MDSRWLRPVLTGAVLMAVLAASFVAVPGPALADANEVSISPAAIEVAPDGSATVQLIADPPAETLNVWAIDVLFDPGVVTTSSRNCDMLDSPADSTLVGFCGVNDKDGDGVVETVTPVGAIIFNDDGSGLKERTVLADITFEVVGAPGECSDLRVGAAIHVDSAGVPTEPLVFDGRICVEQDAPPSGTAVPHTPEARTSEPTPTPPESEETPTSGDETPADGEETPASGEETPADGPQGASPGQSASQAPAAGEGDEDGGGDGVLIWALVAVAGLIVAAGVAWAVVRRRGANSGPEGGPSAG